MPYKLPWTPEVRAHRNKHRREARKKYKARSICTSCMARATQHGAAKCEVCQAREAVYYLANRDEILARVLAYQKEFPRLGYHREYIRKRRDEVIDFLGGCCVRCGFTDRRALQIDHIHGGGVREHRTVRSTVEFLKRVLRYRGRRYQLLCANCNWIKKYEKGENAHRFTAPPSLARVCKDSLGTSQGY